MDDEAQRLADREEFVTSIDVYDSEWDDETYRDIGEFGIGVHNELVITNREDRVVALYAPGSWHKVEVSRVPRLESTSDTTTTDGETDAPTERHA